MTHQVLGVAAIAFVLGGCALEHRRDEDGGIPRDSGQSDGARCGAIRCLPDCEVVTGPDGCAACRCAPSACATDADCTIAWDLSDCCGQCPGARLLDEVAADRCLVRDGDPFPTDCRPATCRDDCPAIDCAFPPRAACEAGACVPSFECRADQVLERNECVPRCATHADCVVATDAQRCCGRLCDALARTIAEERPCFVGPGESGADCPLPIDHCADLGCAVMECPESAHAACLDTGSCALVEGPEPCPLGYLDLSGRCVPAD